MKRVFFLFLPIITILAANCGNSNSGNSSDERIITVSIAPFSYFVRAIGGNDFSINVMVPPGSDPHVYEPFPDQVSRLRKSEGYISNGYLGFEEVWLDRFYEANRKMKKLNLGEGIEPVGGDHREGGHSESADPHYWVSLSCALKMAVSVRDFMKELNPEHSDIYDNNFDTLAASINELDRNAKELFSAKAGKAFMIYHPNLAYMARDYRLKEVAVETEGKEPSPSGLKDLIDLARRENIRTIFVQREYDKRNAKAIAAEAGAELVVIDPLSADWLTAENDIISKLAASMN